MSTLFYTLQIIVSCWAVMLVGEALNLIAFARRFRRDIANISVSARRANELLIHQTLTSVVGHITSFLMLILIGPDLMWRGQLPGPWTTLCAFGIRAVGSMVSMWGQRRFNDYLTGFTNGHANEHPYRKDTP